MPDDTGDFQPGEQTRTILAFMRILLTTLLLTCFTSAACATDWLTLPSKYTHSSESGVRVSQYAAITPPTAPMPANFRSSGFTHTRSSLNYGASADNYHRTQRWGDPVRPYGEWRFPFRPYSTPYPNWGAPYAGFNLGVGIPGYGPGYGYRPDRRPGGHHPGQPGRGHDPGGVDRRPRPHYPTEPGYLGNGTWPIERKEPDGNLMPATPFNPYPAGPGTGYPTAPYYDGYYGG
jgi:hypothetical protein